LVWHPIKRLVPVDRHGHADELLRRGLAGQVVRNEEGLRVTKDGAVIDVLLSLSLLRDEGGEPVAVASIAKDITEQRRSIVEFEGMIRAIDRVQAVIEFERDGTIIRANDNFLSAFGYRLEEIVGRHHRIFCDPAVTQSEDYAAFWRRLGQGEFESGEFKRHAKDGSEVWLQASYNPVFDNVGNLVKVVKFASDITEQVRARSMALLQMATPVTGIWEGVLLLPVVGIIDPSRADNNIRRVLTAHPQPQPPLLL